jgi:hypothetical protein
MASDTQCIAAARLKVSSRAAAMTGRKESGEATDDTLICEPLQLMTTGQFKSKSGKKLKAAKFQGK